MSSKTNQQLETRLAKQAKIEKEIETAIQYLHSRQSGNFESLIKQVNEHYKPLIYNPAQYISSIVEQLELFLEFGRATGKSTLIADRIRKLVYEMPRSKGFIVGNTFQQILTRTLPSTIQGLRMQGLFEGLHYFVSKRPPVKWQKSWAKAYQEPLKNDNYISFHNGTGIHLISQDGIGMARGINTDWGIGDEAALLDKNKLDEEVHSTNRGTNVDVFEGNKLFGSLLYTSSTPLTLDGQWFIDMELQALANPKKMKFLRADARLNYQNLRKGWFADMKRMMPDYLYQAEIMNKRVGKTENSFYPLLSQSHEYSAYDYGYYQQVSIEANSKGDGDCDTKKPLYLGIDFGAAINCMIVGQETLNGFNIINDLFVLTPKIVDDLMEQFAKYYESHEEKLVYMYYDSSANNAKENSRITTANQAAEVLKKRGWRVLKLTTSRSNALHETRFNLWNILLKGEPGKPQIRFNKENCKHLLFSMQQAPAKKSSKGLIQKNKGSERNTKEALKATHLSDAADYLILGLFSNLLRGYAQLPQSQSYSK
jgi:hypothetical protein